jgi:ADP-ribose pyrophosphatase YjhB (NUDIX family)
VTARCCLRCGGRLVVALEGGHRRRRCPRCGWTYYANPVPAAAAVVIQRGRLLLGRRARPPYRGSWDLPGGFLETNELPFEALGRELREELGVGLRRATLIGFATDPYGPGGFTVLSTIYRAHLTSHRLRPGDDVSDVTWFPLPRIPYPHIAFPKVRQFLHHYVKSLRRSRKAN